MWAEVDGWLETRYGGAELSEQEVKSLCAKAREVLSQEQNVQQVVCPVTVLGLYLTILLHLFSVLYSSLKKHYTNNSSYCVRWSSLKVLCSSGFYLYATTNTQKQLPSEI